MTSTPSTTPHRRPSHGITERLVEKVAAKEGLSATALDRPLYDVVDPDALEALFGGVNPPESVGFTYLGYRIELHGDGRIDVTDTAD
jgi:hypothetical protein